MEMTPPRLAEELGMSPKVLRSWLRRTFRRSSGEWNSRWELTEEQVAAARRHFGGRGAASPPPPPATTTKTTTTAAASVRPPKGPRSRDSSDEAYVLDLCDEILQERSQRQHTFPWLVGDPGSSGRCVCLPVDGYYQGLALVIEYRERQHDEAVPFFDRRQTVSGVGRGEQRRLYDQRRETEIPKHELQLVIIRPSNLSHDGRLRLLRDRERDLATLTTLLRPYGARSPIRPS
jgi:hypothetical protein